MASKEQAKEKRSSPRPATQNVVSQDQLLHNQVSAMQPARLAPQMLTPGAVLHMQRTLGNQALTQLMEPLQRLSVQTQVIQRVRIAGIDVSNQGRMPTWEQNGKTYHINLTTETFHITEEDSPKIHYFYQGYGTDIEDKQPSKGERGGSAKKKKEKKTVRTKRVFSELPQAVQSFIKNNYAAILQV